MKLKAKIFQIIRWEEKDKYFFQTEFGEVPVDLLHLSPIDDDKIRWYDRLRGILSFPIFIHKTFLSKEKRWKYHNLMFTQKIYDQKGYYSESGLPLLASRPNNFEVGDIIVIDYEIKKEEMKK